jgi:hypothetical protein
MCAYEPKLDMAALYRGFDAPVTLEDCGRMCAPYNPNGKPFCCDICHAVPVAYHQEWTYLTDNTDLWHEWRGDECTAEPVNPAETRADTPDHLTLLACKGPAECQRNFRATSCRQFPFFPYVTEDFRFIGLAYYWDFEPFCWVLSHLDRVTETYRRGFVATFDELFNQWPDEFESYAALSIEARDYFSGQHRRIPLLHRDGGIYLLSPKNERMYKTTWDRLQKFGPYKG